MPTLNDERGSEGRQGDAAVAGGPVFPSVQSVRLLLRTGRKPCSRSLSGTDAQLVVRPNTSLDERPGPIGISFRCSIFKYSECEVRSIKQPNIF